MKKKELKNIKITKIKPYENNPRKNDEAVGVVAKSLNEFGFIKNSIIVDEGMVLITGHTTLRAMQSLGWNEVPEVTQVTGLSEAHKKAYRLADNKTGEVAKWDIDKLKIELDSLSDLPDVIDLLDFGEIKTVENPSFELEDFIFEDVEIPCWFVIRADISKYSEIKAQLEALKIEMVVEDSNDGTY